MDDLQLSIAEFVNPFTQSRIRQSPNSR